MISIKVTQPDCFEPPINLSYPRIGNYNVSDWVRENENNGFRLLTRINGDNFYKTGNKISIGFYREDISVYLFEFYKMNNVFIKHFMRFMVMTSVQSLLMMLFIL